MIKLEKGFKQFLIKTSIFVLLFIAFSLVIGTKLYANNLLDGWKIGIYGRVGYILLFSIAGFILLYREKLLKIEGFKYKPQNFLLVIVSFILLALFYFFEVYAYKFQINLLNIIVAHLLGLSIFIFLILGIYGLNFIVSFLKKFKKEVLYFLGFAVVTGSLMNIVWNSWPYLSNAVTVIVYALLKLINSSIVQLIPPRTLIFGNFGAQIEEACSGVYSIFLFTALYLFIVFVDWNEISKKKAIILFIPAVLGSFLVNVFRIFLLFVIGAFISPAIAMGLYHSYAGMIFFLIYFGIFWLLLYNWMKKPEFKSKKKGFIKRWFSHLVNDSLYRNSVYLMLSTFVMAALGFVFWIIGARLFTTEQIGLATAIISSMALITSFSLLGLNAGLIRYLPKSKRKDDKINTSFTLVAIVTVIISSLFLLFIKEFSPKLFFIQDHVSLAFVFIFFMIFGSFSSLIDSVFMSYRVSKFVLLKNTIFSVLKIFLLFAFVGLGAYGIFASWMIAVLIGFLTVLLVLVYKFGYKPKFVFYDSIVRQIGKYSFGNYVSGFIGSLPTLVLPLLILNSLGAESSAYYFIAMQIAAVLFIIPSATSNSLFAEGSHDEKDIKQYLKKSIKITSILIIPAILAIVFFGQYILLIFGKNYSSAGFRFLQLMAVSGIFVSINGIFGTLLRVEKKIRTLVYMSVFSSVLMLGLSYCFIIEGWGLSGIGYAWIIGNAIVSVVYFLVWRRGKKIPVL